METRGTVDFWTTAAQVPYRDIPRKERPTASRRLRRAKAASRRRMIATLLATAVVATAFGLGRALSSANGFAPGHPLPVTIAVTVAPGDTPWSIARRYGDPERSILDRIEALHRANEGGLSTLRPGQRILVPIDNPVELARLQTNLASAR